MSKPEKFCNGYKQRERDNLYYELMRKLDYCSLDNYSKIFVLNLCKRKIIEKNKGEGKHD